MSTFEAFSLSTPVNLLSLPIPTAVPKSRFLAIGSGSKDSLIQWRQLMIPSALGALLLNVITQGMCVRGVNRLTTVSWACSRSRVLRWTEGELDDSQSGIDDTQSCLLSYFSMVLRIRGQYWSSPWRSDGARSVYHSLAG